MARPARRLRRRRRALRPGDGPGGPCRADTPSKMFCGCPTEFGAEPNSQVCPVCLGLPGSLPVVNEKAVESAIRIGLALGCEIAPWSTFAARTTSTPTCQELPDRQYDEPIAFEGTGRDRARGRHRVTVRDRARAHGGRRRQAHRTSEARRAASRALSIPRRLQPCGRPAGRDRDQADLRHRGRAPEVGKAYVGAIRDIVRALGISEARMEQRQPALRRERVDSSARRQSRARHPHRDEERQLDALGRAGGAVRDPAAGRDPRCGWHDHAGDPALARGHRHDLRRSAASRTPTTTATSPSPTCCRSTVGRADRVAAGGAARGAGRATSPAARGVGVHRAGVPRRAERGRCSSRSKRPSPRVPPPAQARKWWTGEIARLANASGCRAGFADHAGFRCRTGRARRVGRHQRQARPPGHRGCASRGRVRRGGRRCAWAQGRLG